VVQPSWIKEKKMENNQHKRELNKRRGGKCPEDGEELCLAGCLRLE